MADTNAQSGLSDWGPLIGAGAQGLASYLGNRDATGALTGAEQNAIGTQTGLQGQLTGIYAGQRGLGTGADLSLASSLGLNGNRDYSQFFNSPGFQGSLALGNQAIERAASANGGLYTPNMLNQLGQYDTTYASQNYNNYINQLMSAAGLGAQGNAGLASNIYGTGANISQLQQNQGNARAGGATNQSGIVSNLLGKVPWSQVGNSVSNWWNGTQNNPDTSGTNGSGYSFDNYTGGGYDPNLNTTDVNNLGTNIFNPGSGNYSFDTGYSSNPS